MIIACIMEPITFIITSHVWPP